ncbi:hypothetical protein MMC10_005834 [Thelotrema lepadinum]|nr:hypothetical protein [Thelotrema lepadinum]
MPIAKTEKDFSKIFIPCSANRPKSTQVMLTLSSAVESLDKATQQAELQQQPQSQSQFSSSEQDLRAIVMQASQSNAEPTTAQGQIAVYVNIDELAAKFRPFRPPPPPVPMPDMNDHDSAQPAQATPAPQLDLPVAVVEEISEEASEQNAPQTEPRHPFLNRLYVKHLIREGYLEKERQEILQAISVKRQRKLKMKKHKYKKLMKRTRNLRRRQDRL